MVKNKVAPPFKEAEFDIVYGTGISRTGELVDIGSNLGILDKSGTWYSYGEERLGQGRENSMVYLNENPAIAKEVEMKIRDKMGFNPAPKVEEPAEPEKPKEKTKK